MLAIPSSGAEAVSGGGPQLYPAPDPDEIVAGGAQSFAWRTDGQCRAISVSAEPDATVRRNVAASGRCERG